MKAASGIDSTVDEDRFNGPLAELRAFSAAVFAERATCDALVAQQRTSGKERLLKHYLA